MSRDGRNLRLLVVAPFPPRRDGSHGGSRAIAQLVAELASRHRVALIYLRGVGEPDADSVLRERCDRIEAVGSTSRNGWLGARISKRLRVRLALLEGTPTRVGELTAPEFPARLERIAAEWQPDIVQLEFAVMGQFLPALAGCAAPRVLREHDPPLAAAAETRSTFRRFTNVRSMLEVRAWKRFERAVVSQLDALVVLTARDRDAFDMVVGTVPLHMIPLGFEVPERPLDPRGTDPNRVLFFGSFIHAPNVAAALRLGREIFPRVQTRCPEAALTICGDRPPASLQALAGDQITVTGYVPDVLSYLDRAAVVVAPISTGGGMRVKVMEALASGKALVASPRALEGLEVENGRHVVVAESDEEFAEAIVGLLGDPERREALGREAHAWARSHLGFDRSAEAFERLYASLLEPGSTPAGAAVR